MLPKLDHKIIEIAAGHEFVLALTEDHAVYLSRIPSSYEFEHYYKLMTEAPNDEEVVVEAIKQAHQSYDRPEVREVVQWQRLSLFCDDSKATGIQADGVTNLWDDERYSSLMLPLTKIRHIKAGWDTFTMIDPEAGNDDLQEIVIQSNVKDLSRPIVIPKLQRMRIEDAVSGFCWTGRTRDGQLLMWNVDSYWQSKDKAKLEECRVERVKFGEIQPKDVIEAKVVQGFEEAEVDTDAVFVIDFCLGLYNVSFGVLVLEKRMLVRR